MKLLRAEKADYVICRHCRKPFRGVNAWHLVYRHEYDPGHPVLEYKARFSLGIADSLNTRERRSQARIAWFDRHGRRWTADSIRKTIERRATKGRPLNCAAVTQNCHGLYYAGSKFYGSWRKAVEAAGIKYKAVRITHPWSKERVLRELKEAAREGVPLNVASVQEHNAVLVTMAYSLFASWKKAVEAAGLPYTNKLLEKAWTPERIRSVILDRSKKAEPLTSTVMGKLYSGLYDAAIRIHGSWAKALRACGIPWKTVRKAGYWSRKRITTTIRTLARKRRPLNARHILYRLGGLHTAALREFGSWRLALEACGLDYDKVQKSRRWWPDDVRKKIRTRQRLHQPLNSQAVKEQDGTLYSAARSLFGSWYDALEECGIPANSVRKFRTWTKDSVVQAIQSDHTRRKAMNYKAVENRDLGLLQAAVFRFGSWTNALRSAGIHPPDPPGRRKCNLLSRKRNHPE